MHIKALFERHHLAALRINPSSVVAALFPDFTVVYKMVVYRMFSDIDWVYVTYTARKALDWVPRYHFYWVLQPILDVGPIGNILARDVGAQ